MGKLKISKAKKNKSSKGTSGIPNWLLSTLVIIVVLAVLATCAGTFIASSGIVMRWSTAMSLNNYKVDGNMMAYFYQTTYMNFMSNYSSYLSYLSYDQNKSPKDQQFAPEGSYDSAFLGQFSGTWHDYFMNQTKDSVKNLLIYCAQADKLGITLEETDETEIEASIDTLLINIRSTYGNGLSEDTCFANVYGKGVNRGDIRNAMKLSALASKAAQKISDDIEASITDERIDSTYADNTLDYDLVDYFKYSFTVYYDDVITEKYGDSKKAETLTDDEKAVVLALYKEKIAAAHAAATELAGKTTLADFQKYVVDYAAKDQYDDLFDTAMQKITSEQKPSETDLATIKEKTIAAVADEVNNNKNAVTEDVVKTEVAATDSTEASTTYKLYDITVTAEFAEAAKTLKSNLFDKVSAVKTDNLLTKTNYIAPDSEGNKDDVSEWAFSADRKANDVKNIESGDGANEAEVTVSTESFSAEVVFLIKTVYRDETLSRNLAYMLFTDADEAATAIEALEAIEGLDKDKFLGVANDENNPASASTYLEDCAVGSMQSDDFDAWLFAETTTAGSYTKEAIKMSDGSLMVALYVSEGSTPAWKYTVKSAIYSDDYTKYEEQMNESFASSVVINDGTISKVGL